MNPFLRFYIAFAGQGRRRKKCQKLSHQMYWAEVFKKNCRQQISELNQKKCRSKGRASGFVNFNLTKNITSPDFSILSESELRAIKVFSLFDCLVCNLPSAVEEILQNSLTFIRSARCSADCAQVVGSHCKRVSEHEYQCSSCITPITI